MSGDREGGLFLFIGLVLLLLGIFTVYRLAVDTRERTKAKGHFAASPAASPSVFSTEAEKPKG